MEAFKHPPGSQQAVAQGCTCSTTTLNRRGNGTPHGQPRF